MPPLKEDIQTWINALRSGEYTQTRLHLQDKRGYCCLGVACTLFIPDELQDRLGDMLVRSLPLYQPNAPDWLKHVNSNFYSLTGEPLSDCNDTQRMSFDEIADLLQAVYIEEVLS